MESSRVMPGHVIFTPLPVPGELLMRNLEQEMQVGTRLYIGP